jgi:hypothetical protein
MFTLVSLDIAAAFLCSVAATIGRAPFLRSIDADTVLARIVRMVA